MKNYQKASYIRIWIPILIFIAIIGGIFLYREYTQIFEYGILFLLTLILGGIVGGIIGCFLFQIMGGRILDYQMSKQLDENLFYLYMERRKMTRSDISFENCVGISETKKSEIRQIKETLETHLKKHRLLHLYYRTFLMDCFIEI